jgi:hypothetical protein
MRHQVGVRILGQRCQVDVRFVNRLPPWSATSRLTPLCVFLAAQPPQDNLTTNRARPTSPSWCSEVAHLRIRVVESVRSGQTPHLYTAAACCCRGSCSSHPTGARSPNLSPCLLSTTAAAIQSHYICASVYTVLTHVFLAVGMRIYESD